MSSSRARVRSALVPLSPLWAATLIAILLAAWAASQAAAQTPSHPAPDALACPAKISVAESASPPVGWRIEPSSSERLFERISVYQLSAKNEEFDLAPDNETRSGSAVSQIWNIPAKPDLRFMMRCRYRNTPVTLTREIPLGVRACRLSYVASADGSVSGPSQMSCR